MEILTTREKIARKEGRKEGHEAGLQDGMREMLEILLDKHEIRLTGDQRDQFQSLDEDQLKQAALLVHSPAAFTTWLDTSKA